MRVGVKESESVSVSANMLNPESVVPSSRRREQCESADHGAADGGAPFGRWLDRPLDAAIARLTGGVSPAAFAGAFFDWALHLSLSPDKQRDLASRAVLGALKNLAYAWTAASAEASDPCACARPQDNRFRAPDWQKFPF